MNEKPGVLDRLRNALPDWGPVRWVVVLGSLAVFLLTGISLFHQPRAETLYSVGRQTLANVGSTGTTLVVYSIEVGNTGAIDQPDVELHLAASAMAYAMLSPYAKNYGVSDRPIRRTQAGDRTILALGPLAPELRVRVTVMLSYPPGAIPHTTEQCLLAVRPAVGPARHGDPGMTLVGRAWFRIFGDWLRL